METSAQREKQSRARPLALRLALGAAGGAAVGLAYSFGMRAFGSS